MKLIDLNCDMGELPEMLADGTQEELMKFVTSVNIACGGHAGDAAMMHATIEQAQRHGIAVGAHPGYEDPQNFGRLELQLSPEEVRDSVYRQLIALATVAEKSGAPITHVKAHGALYNQAARNAVLARSIAEGVRRWRQDVLLVGLAGSMMLEEFRAAGFRVAAEAFADRRYEKDGSLRARKFRDALLHEPEQAAEQALRIVEKGSVLTREGEAVHVEAQTICIHGDTPGATRIAQEVQRALEGARITVKALDPKI
jgi:UPF0271 protein